MTTVESTKSRSHRASPGGLRFALRTRIELWLAVLFMALAFGAGIAVGVTAGPAAPPAPAVGVAPIGQLPVAPPLTPEQIEQGLPSGHPDVGGGSGGPQAGGRKSQGSNAADRTSGTGSSGSTTGSP